MFIFKGESFSKTLVTYLVYVLITTFPFLVYKNFIYGGTATRAINIEIVAIVSAIIIGIGIFRKTVTFQKVFSPITIVLGLYFLILVLSMFFGVDPHTSFWSKSTRTTGLYFTTHLVLLYFVFTSIFSDEKIRIRAINLFIYSSAIYSVLTFLGIQGIGLVFPTYINDGFTFQNSSFAAMHLVAAVLLLLYRTNLSGWNWRWVTVFTLLLINPFFISNKVWFGKIDFPSGIIGEAKASALAVGFVIILYILGSILKKIKKESVKKYAVIGIAVFCIGSLAFISGSLISSEGIVRKQYLTQASAVRPIVWDLSKKSIAERPLLGWGTDNFDRSYEKYFDSRVLEERYGNEAWLDRAHTPLLDQAVENGYIGVIAYVSIFLVTFGAMILIIVQSNKKSIVVLASMVGIYSLVHFLELQTAFDTSISALSFVMIMALGTIGYSEYRIGLSKTLSQGYTYLIGVIFLTYFTWSFFAGVVPIFIAQNANGDLRRAGTSEKRLPLYSRLLASPIDVSTVLWRTSTDLQRGIIENPGVLNDVKKAQQLKKEFDVIIEQYKKYIIKNPDDVRSLLSLTDLLLYTSLFGEDNIELARQYINSVKILSPGNPMPYWMEAISYVYQGKIKDARVSIESAKKINQNAAGTKDIERYIEEASKSFPEIEMYFFKQI